MKYKAVGFDYGGVLAGPPGSGFGKEVCKLLKIDKQRYDELYFSRYRRLNLDQVTWLELWKEIFEELSQMEKWSLFLKIDNKYHHNRSLNFKVVKLAQILKKEGLKVGILSNNSAEMAHRMRSDLGDVFETIHVSAETGFVKPDSEGFKYFAETLGVELQELIFIDDAENSLKTAKECGFKDVLFTGYEQLVKDLEALGIMTRDR